jgi:hypothetical protein
MALNRRMVESLKRIQRPVGSTVEQFNGLYLRLRLAEAGDAVAVLPLAAFLEEFGALEALEDIALAPEGGRRAQTAML